MQEMYENISKCSRCGKCLSVCPIYRETKKEGSVARGRNRLLGYSVEGKIPFDQELTETLYECLLCGRCEEICTASVPTPDIIREARATYAKDHVPLVQKLIFNQLLPHQSRLKLANRLLKIYQDTGLRFLLKKSGLIGVLGPLAKSEDVIPNITPTFRDKQSTLESNPLHPKYKVAYFLGCGTNLLKASEGIAGVNTLRKLGCHVEVPEVFCCGLPAVTYGQTDVGCELAKKNIDLLLKDEYEYIVSDCASCCSMLKDYPKLFESTDPYHVKAKQVAVKIMDYSQMILKVEGERRTAKEAVTVTYHVPCHIARGLKAAQDPKNVLQNIKGINYVEMPDADVCCGAAGSYFVTHPDLSDAVLRRKMENIRSTGAQVVVTSCPMCMMQLEHGARLYNVPVKVKHLAEIVAESD